MSRYSPSILLLTATLCVPWLRAEHQPFPDRDDHWLAFDNRAFDTSSAKAVKLVHGTIRKHPDNPLVPADKPWEEGLNNLYPNIDYDPEEKLYKLWYKCILEDKALIDRMQPPRTTHGVGWYLLYATSRDGLMWEKPLFDQHSFTGAGPTNAVARDAPNAGVFRDTNPAASADRRYKMIFDRGPGNLFVAFSPDGIHWAEPIAVTIPGYRAGDTHNNAFWDQRLGKYVLITRYYPRERTVARSESEDFIHWKPSELVLRPTMEEGKAHQLYCMPAFRYGNAFIGLLMVYHIDDGRTVDCELAWSPDSREWHRLLPGKAFIPLGPEGSYDSKCIYAQANPPIVDDKGRLQIFYGGDDFPHQGWVRHCLPCLATVHRDGFAGWRSTGGEKTGSVRTHPLRVTGEISLTAEFDGDGSIRAELLDADGNPIPGFGLTEFVPIHSGDVDLPLQWKDADLSNWQGKIVQLQFEISGGAKLFSIGGFSNPGSPRIMPTSRPFSENLTVAISHPDDEAGVVRHTLDGSRPTADSPEIEGELTLTDSTHMQARFFPADSDGAGGAVIHRHYRKREPWSGPKKVVTRQASFDESTEDWSAADTVKFVAKGGVDNSGYVTVERKGNRPVLSAESTASGGGFVGDWPATFQGVGCEISFHQRESGESRESTEVTIVAKNVASWTRKRLANPGPEWSRVVIPLRFDWTDEEAKAAGWVPSIDAFSWEETLRHVGRLTIAPASADPEAGDLRTVEIDEITVKTIFSLENLEQSK